MLRLFKNYLKDESGQTSTEYILLIAVVAMVIFKFKTTFSENMTKIIDSVFEGGGMQGLLNDLNQ